ncbi:ion channel [Pseudooceanicola sp. 502str34]
MLAQFLIGSGLTIVSTMIAALVFGGISYVLGRLRGWLERPPHAGKQMLMLAFGLVGAMLMITASVWVWAAAYRQLGIFETLEESLYFSLVAFTTLGFGDIVLPQEWRLLSGLTAVNGILNVGVTSAMIMNLLREMRPNRPGPRLF